MKSLISLPNASASTFFRGDGNWIEINSTTDTNAWTAGIISDQNVFQIDLNTIGNLKADGNYLCDSVNCYLISDLNISGTVPDLSGYVSWVDGNATYYKQTDFNYLTFLTDATSDGNTYGRKNGAWEKIVSGAGGEDLNTTMALGNTTSYDLNLYKTNPTIKLTDRNGLFTTITKKDANNEFNLNTYVHVLPLSTDLVPKMTSNTAPSGVVSSSSAYGGFPAWNVFADDSTTTQWASNGDSNPWIQYQFTAGQVVTRYTIQNGTNSAQYITDWNFLGSNDGVNFTLLDIQRGQILGSGGIGTYDFNNTTAYAYYRIQTIASTQYIRVAEVQLITYAEFNTDIPLIKTINSSINGVYGETTWGNSTGYQTFTGTKLDYQINGITKATIASDGNLGIGTTAPRNKLNVVGDINATTNLTAGGLTLGRIVFPTTGGLLTGDGNLFWDNTNKRLGIGTSAPTALLHAVSATNNTGFYSRISTTSGSNYGLDAGSIGAGATLNVGGYFGALNGTTNYGVQIGAPTAGANNYALYSSSAAQSYFAGNVGIGVTAPATILHTRETTAFSNGITVESTAANNANDTLNVVSARLGYSGGTDGAGIIRVGKETNWTSTASTRDAFMSFWTSLDSGQTEKMRITSAGNVGIGTTAPAEKLHVNGNVLLNDNNKLMFGDAKDATITYDGSNMVINPKSVGSGNLTIQSDLSITGTNSNILISPAQTASGELKAGTSFGAGGTNENTSFLPDFGGSTTASINWVAYNGSAWKSIIEYNNTTGEADVNLILGKTSGKIGIGTASPTVKLDVNGAIKAIDYYSADGNIGYTGDCTVGMTLTVKNGLIVGCS
jgi:hypothetical protein